MSSQSTPPPPPPPPLRMRGDTKIWGRLAGAPRRYIIRLLVRTRSPDR